MSNDEFKIENVQEGDTEHLKILGPLTLNNLFEFQNAARQALSPKTIIDLV